MSEDRDIPLLVDIVELALPDAPGGPPPAPDVQAALSHRGILPDR